MQRVQYFTNPGNHEKSRFCDFCNKVNNLSHWCIIDKNMCGASENNGFLNCHSKLSGRAPETHKPISRAGSLLKASGTCKILKGSGFL